jgi:hypothetical protein
MTSRSRIRCEQARTYTHIIVRANAAGECEFLNDIAGGWTKYQYLAIPFTSDRAEQVAAKVGGMSIPTPAIDLPKRTPIYEYEA